MDKPVKPIIGKQQVIEHLTQLRRSLAHALKQPNISPARFNDIRAQLLPLDEQLRILGVDMEPTPQMSAHHIVLTRKQKRHRNRESKHSTYEQRLMQRIKYKRDLHDDDN